MIEKLGHLAPINCRINKFNSIELNGDFAYCKSHNFVYNPEIEEEKLYNGLPCYYTDLRFTDTTHNYFHRCKIHWTRWKNISLKACIRRTLKVKNIPIGTLVKFEKSWYHPGTKIDNSYNFKIKKENKLDINFEVNIPEYFAQFTNCSFSKELTSALRSNGFLVRVTKNESFLANMFNTAIFLSGSINLTETEIEGEIAIAYGHGKKIGFSSFNNDFMGYSNGEHNILWDNYGEFDKWSKCITIPKNTPIEEILEILITKQV